MSLRERIAEIAEREYENARTAQNNMTLYSYNRDYITKLTYGNPSTYHNKSKYTQALGYSAAPWCGDFVEWVVDSLDGVVGNNDKITRSILPGGGSARSIPKVRNFYKSNRDGGVLHTHDGYAPHRGDIVIFDWEPNGNADHIGIVVDVNNTTKQFTYVDGNNTSVLDRFYQGSYGFNSLDKSTKRFTDNKVLGFVEVKDKNPISQDRYESNNTQSAATVLNGNTGSISANIHESGDVDYYRIQLGATGGRDNFVKASFTHSQGDIDMELYTSAGNLVGSSSGSGNEERISLNGKPAGTYYAKVYGFSGATNKNYSLAWDTTPSIRPDRYESNNSRSSAERITGRSGIERNLTLHTGSDEDWFEFTLTGARKSNNHISITNGNSGEMIEIYNNNGARVKSFQRSHNLSGLANGTYYAKVYSAVELPSSNYTLSYDITPDPQPRPDRYEPNNTRNDATRLNGTTGSVSANISSGDVDYYRIQLGSTGDSRNYIKTNFTHSQGDIDMELYNSAGSLVGSSRGSGNEERISLSGQSAGTYYVKVYGYGGATNSYSLAWNTEGLRPDRYESNNTQINATRLNNFDVLSANIHDPRDVDYYRIQLGSTGNSSNGINLSYDQAAGDIDMKLYDSAGREVGSSTGVTGRESISLNGKSAGTYYVKVYGYGNATGSYAMNWSTIGGSQSSRAAAPASQSMTDARSIMYDTSADAYASLLSSSGSVTLAASQSGDSSLRRFGALASAM